MEAGEGENEEEDLNPKNTAKPAFASHHIVALSPSPHIRKGTCRRKKFSLSAKQRKAAEERLIFLNENFRLVPFFPAKTLDFSTHEELFHALGLWDFAHLQLDEELRSDLLADLIAYYDSSNHRSYVNKTRIYVTRVDFARAIRLPTKKERADVSEGKNLLQEMVSVDGAITFLLDFMSNYMFFAEMCILPPEIVQAIRLVKEGFPYKVDWAGVMWVLVERELSEGYKSGNFCYASHLQCLMKHQRPHLFSKEPEFVLPVPEHEEEEVSLADEAVNVAEDEVDAAEEDSDADTRKMRSLQDLVNVASEGHESEFGLIQGENVMDGFDDCKVNGDGEWLDGGKNEGFQKSQRCCNSKASDNMNLENLAKMDEEENLEERFEDGVSVKFSTLERLNSSDILLEMHNVGIPYAAQPAQVNSISPSEALLAMRADSHKNIILDRGLGVSTYYGYNGKRQFDEIGDEERGSFDHKCQRKKLQACESWENLPFSFDECMNQVQGGVKKAKALYAEKEQAVLKMEEQMQYLNHLLHDKELATQSLKMMLEGQQNWQMAIRHYEHELCLVTQMMLGYKRALKETRVRFADYRKQHPRDDESLYKDVRSSGGLVLSAMEFEKDRLVKEEEKRQQLMLSFGNFEQTLNKVEKCEECIITHDSRLRKLVGEMEQVKDSFVKSSCLDA